MIFKELLDCVSFDEVFSEYLKLIEYYNLSDKQKCLLKAKLLGVYKELYNQTKLKLDDRQIIAVIRYQDSKDSYYYETSIWKNNNGVDHYAFNFISWQEIASSEVFQKSIDEYGSSCVCACILYELTEFGFTEEERNINESNLKVQLERALKEIDEGATIPFEEVVDEFRLSEISENFNDNQRKNIKTYNDYLSQLKNILS